MIISVFVCAGGTIAGILALDLPVILFFPLLNVLTLAMGVYTIHRLVDSSWEFSAWFDKWSQKVIRGFCNLPQLSIEFFGSNLFAYGLMITASIIFIAMFFI